MATKKQGTPTITQRAGLIIADLKGYDADTRLAIYNALEGEPGMLAELVKRAEAGEIVLDCTKAAHAPEGTPQRLINYPPEIESRRADYRALAENFISMIALDSERQPQPLDIVPTGAFTDEVRPHILINAIHDHINGLFESYSDALLLEDDFLRFLYVELRLFYDMHTGWRKGGAR